MSLGAVTIVPSGSLLARSKLPGPQSAVTALTEGAVHQSRGWRSPSLPATCSHSPWGFREHRDP